MWSRDSQLYVLTWAGAVIAIFGLVVSVIALVHPEGFPITPGQLAYVGGSCFLGGAVFLGAWRLLSSAIARPDIETISLTKSLTISDATGNDALLLRTEEYRVNRKADHHILTVGGIAATGEASEIKIDGEIIPKPWERRPNSYRVSKSRAMRLTPGQKDSWDCEIRFINSFTQDKETFEHEASQPLRLLVLQVTFPSTRKPRRIGAYLEYGGQTHAELPKPEESQGGRTHTITIKRPQQCGSYVIEWEW